MGRGIYLWLEVAWKGNFVNRTVSILVLIVAATLEAGGDALMRIGLHSAAIRSRLAFFAVAAVVLFAYGWTVNAAPWDFGKLLGLYVVFFFVIAQFISWLVFKQAPSAMVLVGGCLIAAGGIVIALAKA
jgi:small multidrug resistance family-3 protein